MAYATSGFGALAGQGRAGDLPASSLSPMHIPQLMLLATSTLFQIL